MSRLSRVLQGRGPWIAVSAALLAALVTPIAIAQSTNDGKPLRGGARNPSTDQRQSFTKETEIIADNSTYGTRQSNKSGNGGGAIYGCRSGLGGTPQNNEPCLRANNLADGRAFELVSSGKNATEVGRIEAANPNAKPFTTNATGVADGLNADQVDGQSAAEIVSSAQSKNLFAKVSDTGVLGQNRGATGAVRTSVGDYSVTFASDVSACAWQVTEPTRADGGASVVEAAAPTGILVRMRDAAGAQADRPFNLVVIC